MSSSAMEELREWCNQDHGSAFGSYEDGTCHLSRLLSDEYVSADGDTIRGDLVLEGGDPLKFEINQNQVVDVEAVGGDLRIEVPEGSVILKRDRREMFS